jgi:S1-C subfamily serine protease
MRDSGGISRWLGFGAVLMAVLVGLSGCSSVGYSTSKRISAPKVVKAPSSVPGQLTSYLPRFTDALEKHGFTVGQTDDPQALQLKLAFNRNPFNLQVKAYLWQNGTVVLSAEATNSGWGTALARGAAVEALVDNAVEDFTEQLKKIAKNIEFIPEKSVAKSETAGGVSSGIAFAIDPGDYFLTAYQLIGGEKTVRLECARGASLHASVENIDIQNGIALLRVGIKLPNYLGIASVSPKAPGTRVFTMSFPQDTAATEPVYSDGVVTAFAGGNITAGLFTANIPPSPGRTGAPVLNPKGEVVGMLLSPGWVASALKYEESVTQGMSWAVRAEYLRPLAPGPSRFHRSASGAELDVVKRVGSSVCRVGVAANGR